jgi:putative endonuclease
VEHDRRALGAHGEGLVARWYVARGYVVLSRNWRTRSGELDLVVGRAGLVVFCEVKARTTGAFGTGAEAVGRAKRQRIRRLAAEWLAAHPRPGCDVRFDVAAVHRGVEVDVVQAAF